MHMCVYTYIYIYVYTYILYIAHIEETWADHAQRGAAYDALVT